MNVFIKHIWHINIKKNRHHLCNTYVKIVNLHVSLKPCNKIKKKKTALYGIFISIFTV